MTDQDCVQFLQWSLPKLRMRWQAFRKVRVQVCKRIDRHIRELNLSDPAAYRSYLERQPDEWHVLDSFCNITISRFYRDKGVFRFLEREVLPRLAQNAISRKEPALKCWSIGCASGEEPYTIALLWDMVLRGTFPALDVRIIATDADRALLSRAKDGCYPESGVRELPKDWLSQAFVQSESRYCIREHLKGPVEFVQQDVRTTAPEGEFHLILCRNIVFTYFEESLQREVLERVGKRLAPGGSLVIGIHESLPQGGAGLEAWPGMSGIFRKGIT